MRTPSSSVSPAASLEGQVALVTGGGRGIGARMARRLSDEGMAVAITSRNAAELGEVAAETGSLPIVADVTREEDVDAMVETTVDTLGAIDLLVANAGVMASDEQCWTVDVSEWWSNFQVN